MASVRMGKRAAERQASGNHGQKKGRGGGAACGAASGIGAALFPADGFDPFHASISLSSSSAGSLYSSTSSSENKGGESDGGGGDDDEDDEDDGGLNNPHEALLALDLDDGDGAGGGGGSGDGKRQDGTGDVMYAGGARIGSATLATPAMRIPTKRVVRGHARGRQSVSSSSSAASSPAGGLREADRDPRLVLRPLSASPSTMGSLAWPHGAPHDTSKAGESSSPPQIVASSLPYTSLTCVRSRRSAVAPTVSPGRVVVVSGLAEDAQRSPVLELLERHGPVRALDEVGDDGTAVLASFYDVRHAQEAVKAVNGYVHDGQALAAVFAPPDSPVRACAAANADQDAVIIVLNVLPSVSCSQLNSVFGRYGPIRRISHAASKRQKVFRFVEYYDLRSARAAATAPPVSDELWGGELDLVVELARSAPASHGAVWAGATPSPSPSSSPLAHSPPSSVTRRSRAASLSYARTPPASSLSPVSLARAKSSTLSPPLSAGKRSTSVPSVVASSPDSPHHTSPHSRSSRRSSRRTRAVRSGLARSLAASSDSLSGSRSRSPSSSAVEYVDAPALRAGTELRTTAMVRNIPNRFSRDDLVAALDAAGLGAGFDFVYLPFNVRHGANAGYAFVNFRTPTALLSACEALDGARWPSCNSDKVCRLAFARLQGRSALVSHFASKAKSLNDPLLRPLVIDF